MTLRPPGSTPTASEAPHDVPRDHHLRAALRHAPDAQVQAPPAVSAHILHIARESVPPHAARRAPRPSLWTWAWEALCRPPMAAGLASVTLATVVGVMWWNASVDEFGWPAERLEARAPTAPAPVPQAAPAAKMPLPTAAEDLAGGAAEGAAVDADRDAATAAIEPSARPTRPAETSPRPTTDRPQPPSEAARAAASPPDIAQRRAQAAAIDRERATARAQAERAEMAADAQRQVAAARAAPRPEAGAAPWVAAPMASAEVAAASAPPPPRPSVASNGAAPPDLGGLLAELDNNTAHWHAALNLDGPRELSTPQARALLNHWVLGPASRWQLRSRVPTQPRAVVTLQVGTGATREAHGAHTLWLSEAELTWRQPSGALHAMPLQAEEWRDAWEALERVLR